MTADRNHLGLALFYALLLLYLAVVPWKAEPRRFENGRPIRATCALHDPMRSDACWSCHGEERL